jgi:uncharacterized protein YuzE
MMSSSRVSLPVAYDRDADAAHIAFVASVLVDDPRLDGYVVFDLDRELRVVGIEVIGAAALLSAEVDVVECVYNRVEDYLRVSVDESANPGPEIAVNDRRLKGEIGLNLSSEGHLRYVLITHAGEVIEGSLAGHLGP